MELKEIINECIEKELSDNFHKDCVLDYPTNVSFYLSNLIGDRKEDYIEKLMNNYGLSITLANHVYDEILDYISLNY